MDNFEQKATFSSVTDQKFCLGGDVFLSVSYFRGANNIHVRKWKSDVDILNPGKCIVYPTKIGIVLSREQLKLLKNLIPHVLSFLDQNEKTMPSQRTQSTYASPALSPCNAPSLMGGHADTNGDNAAPLPADLSGLGFSQLLYGGGGGGADGGADREGDTISISSGNTIEIASTDPQPSAMSGVENQAGGGVSNDSVDGGQYVSSVFRQVAETPKRPTGLLSLKNAPKKRKN